MATSSFLQKPDLTLVFHVIEVRRAECILRDNSVEADALCVVEELAVRSLGLFTADDELRVCDPPHGRFYSSRLAAVIIASMWYFGQTMPIWASEEFNVWRRPE